MQAKTYFSPLALSETELYILLLSVSFLLLFSWAGAASLTSNNFSLNSIFQIHTNLFVWFIDIIILSVPPGILFFTNYHNIKTIKLKDEIRKLYENSKQNVLLAERIGRGELELNNNISDSTLSKVLFTLDKNLKLNKEKEDALNWTSKGKGLILDRLRAHNNFKSLSIDVLKNIIDYTSAIQGAFYIYEGNGELKNIATYAYGRRRFEKQHIPIGKGLIGQAA